VIPEVDLNDDDDDDEDNEVELKKSRKKGGKKDDYPLEVDTYGLPVIPDVEDLNLESKKCLIRTFLTKHYSQFLKLRIWIVDRLTSYVQGCAANNQRRLFLGPQ
jgi:hypothetical protein